MSCWAFVTFSTFSDNTFRPKICPSKIIPHKLQITTNQCLSYCYSDMEEIVAMLLKKIKCVISAIVKHFESTSSLKLEKSLTSLKSEWHFKIQLWCVTQFMS